MEYDKELFHKEKQFQTFSFNSKDPMETKMNDLYDSLSKDYAKDREYVENLFNPDGLMGENPFPNYCWTGGSLFK